MKQMVLNIAGLILAAAGVVGGYLGWTGQQGQVYELGDTVQDFTLTDIHGEMVSLSDYGEVLGYVIIFTCNTCPYSLLYEGRIIEFAGKYSEVGFPVLVLNPNNPEVKPGDDVESLRHRADSLQYNFPYLIDDRKIYERFGSEKLPQVFVLDREKVLRYKGAIDDNVYNVAGVKEKYLEQALTALQNETMPDPGVTRVTGCTIQGR